MKLAAMFAVALFVPGLALAQPAVPECSITWLPTTAPNSFVARAKAADARTQMLCWKRLDASPPLEIACVTQADDGQPVSAQTPATFAATIPLTLNDDPEIRAYAYSTTDKATALESAGSADCATVPFTSPAPPALLP